MDLKLPTRDIEQLVDNGYISLVKHPHNDLYILSYTKKTTINGYWNDLTLNCRGLIVDSEMNVVTRPFKKFFERNQLNPGVKIPTHLKYKVAEKLDGFLGILYWNNNKPYIATKGKFDSFQALVGNRILYKKYQSIFHMLDKNKSYLFEVISPHTTNIVDYENLEDVFLIGVLDTKTGKEENLSDIGYFKKANYFTTDINELLKKTTFNKPEEGFVITFQNDFKLKVKSNQYKKQFVIYQRYKNEIFGAIINNKSVDYLNTNSKDIHQNFINFTFDKGKMLLEYIKQSITENPFPDQHPLIERYKTKYPKKANLELIIFKRLFFTSQYFSKDLPYTAAYLL